MLGLRFPAVRVAASSLAKLSGDMPLSCAAMRKDRRNGRSLPVSMLLVQANDTLRRPVRNAAHLNLRQVRVHRRWCNACLVIYTIAGGPPSIIRETGVKQFSMLGIIVGAALLTAAPLSLHCSPKKGGLYVDKADARVVHRRRPSYGYYDVPYYGALAYPRFIASTPYYNIAPYGGITPYGVMPYPYSVGPPTGGFFMGSK